MGITLLLLLLLLLLLIIIIIIIIIIVKKGIPITGHEGPGGMWMQGSTYSQSWHQDEVGWLVLRSAAFTPGEIPRYSVYRRLSGPQEQSVYKGVKKISTPPIPGPSSP